MYRANSETFPMKVYVFHNMPDKTAPQTYSLFRLL